MDIGIRLDEHGNVFVLQDSGQTATVTVDWMDPDQPPQPTTVPSGVETKVDG